ncbi:S1 family peptidase [Plantactinospora sp. WMMB782]|uniref:S1 family peptidase n=1 Tax=Plantactinospora sp. WMMB782 TaxID=3404121 RepID=UPI003B93798B
MRITGRWLAVVSAAAVVLTLSASPAGAIVGGEVSTRHDGLAVVRHNGSAVCSGAIIDNHWVLTARHCVYRGTERVPNSEISVRVKSYSTHANGSIVAVATSRARTNHDIALLKLAGSANSEPVNMATKSPAVGAPVVAYGYGATADGRDMSALLRRAEMIATSINAADNEGGRAVEARWSNGTICTGDSGGPLFKVVDGSRYLVGITSGTVHPYCSDRAVFSTVPESLDWINTVMDTV